MPSFVFFPLKIKKNFRYITSYDSVKSQLDQTKDLKTGTLRIPA